MHETPWGSVGSQKGDPGIRRNPGRFTEIATGSLGMPAISEAASGATATASRSAPRSRSNVNANPDVRETPVGIERRPRSVNTGSGASVPGSSSFPSFGDRTFRGASPQPQSAMAEIGQSKYKSRSGGTPERSNSREQQMVASRTPTLRSGYGSTGTSHALVSESPCFEPWKFPVMRAPTRTRKLPPSPAGSSKIEGVAPRPLTRTIRWRVEASGYNITSPSESVIAIGSTRVANRKCFIGAA